VYQDMCRAHGCL